MNKFLKKAIGFILVTIITFGTAVGINPVVANAWSVYDTTNYDPNDIDENGNYRYSYDTEGNHREGWTNGFDQYGWNKNGYDIYGYDRDGWNRFGYNRDGVDREGYDMNGYGSDGYNRQGYDQDGYDRDGYNKYGYDRDGYDKNGYNSRGFDRDGYDKNGYDYANYDRNGYNKDGYTFWGYDKNGYDKDGYDVHGYDKNGFDKHGYNKDGYDKNGLNRLGYDKTGYNKDGYDKDGYNRSGYNKDGYDKDGYDKTGFDKAGYDKDGYDKNGYNKNGYDKNGYDKEGYNKKGYDRNGYDKNGYPQYKKKPQSNAWRTIISSKSWLLYGKEICDKKDLGGDKIIQKIQDKITQNSSRWDFEATIKPIAVKEGYGKYKLTLMYGKDYKDVVKTTEFTIFPDFGIEWNPEKRTERLKQKKQYDSIYSTKAAFEHVDGFEYKVMVQKCKYIEKIKGNRTFVKWIPTGRNKLWKKGKIGADKLVKFEKNYAGGEKEYQGKYYDNDCIISPHDTSKIVQIKFRPYINVNGNKIYGAWRYGKL